MTPRQIEQKLSEAGLISKFTSNYAKFEFRRDEVEVLRNFDVSNMGEVEEDVMVASFEIICDKVAQELDWGGYETGYKFWVLSSDYHYTRISSEIDQFGMVQD